MVNASKSENAKLSWSEAVNELVSDLTNDIKSVVSKLQQIDMDIKECMKKGKNAREKALKKTEKKNIKAVTLKQINPTLLDSPVTEKSHSTGNR